tara:strand:- start:6217 stop:6453 length:237 start_codon:yes stop_codon:yes gene_type:complete
MEKLKELWKKLNLKVALIGGVVVISTSLGTCHLMDSGEEAAEEEVPAEEAPAEEAPAPKEEAAPSEDEAAPGGEGESA